VQDGALIHGPNPKDITGAYAPRPLPVIAEDLLDDGV